MMQRVYGTAFFDKADLKEFLKMREEAKERDHRKLGKELDLFMISQEVGSGLPFWLPKGATIRRTIERYIVDKEISLGYQHVYTPVMADVGLLQKLQVTGLTIKKICSHQWKWIMKQWFFVQ